MYYTLKGGSKPKCAAGLSAGEECQGFRDKCWADVLARGKRGQHSVHCVSVVSSPHNIHAQLADTSTLGIRMWGALEL